MLFNGGKVDWPLASSPPPFHAMYPELEIVSDTHALKEYAEDLRRRDVSWSVRMHRVEDYFHAVGGTRDVGF